MVEAAAFVAAAVGDAGRRAVFYHVDRSSELRWGGVPTVGDAKGEGIGGWGG